MPRKRMICVFALVLMFSLLRLHARETSQPQAGQTPKEVVALAGTYTGSWTLFGMDEKGQVVKRASWTDTMKAENPTVKGDRAFVTTTDEMTFEGGGKRQFLGSEGYFLNKDGSLGDYFIESFGQATRLQKLSKTAWAYAAPAQPQELTALGFSNVISGQHVLVKVTTIEQGAETHRISRITTVNWKDKEGKERWIQFVSLQGTHKR